MVTVITTWKYVLETIVFNLAPIIKVGDTQNLKALIRLKKPLDTQQGMAITMQGDSQVGTKCESCGTYHYDDDVGYCDACDYGCQYCVTDYESNYGETTQCVKCTGGNIDDLEIPIRLAAHFIKGE